MRMLRAGQLDRQTRRVTTGWVAAVAVCGATLAVVPMLGGGATPARAQAAHCPWMKRSLSADERARELVAAMNLDQKIAMLSQSQPIWQHYGVAGYVPAQ